MLFAREKHGLTQSLNNMNLIGVIGAFLLLIKIIIHAFIKQSIDKKYFVGVRPYNFPLPHSLKTPFKPYKHGPAIISIQTFLSSKK